MPLEIERRFLVTGEAWQAHVDWVAQIRQGYLLSTEDGLTARIRLQRGDKKGPQAWLTVKAAPGPGVPSTTRLEFEYPIPIDDAETMLELAPWQLEKLRYGMDLEGGDWVLDVFSAENAPLVIAEVELPHPDAPLTIPSWCREEITGRHALSNAALARRPLQSWEPEDISNVLQALQL